jgi:hypothetical protein
MSNSWHGTQDSGVSMKKVVSDPTVDIALRSLDPDGVGRIHAWFDYLKRWDEDEVLRKNLSPPAGAQRRLCLADNKRYPDLLHN